MNQEIVFNAGKWVVSLHLVWTRSQPHIHTHTIPPLLGSKIQSVIWEYVALPHSLQYEFYLRCGLLTSLLDLLFCLLSSSGCLFVWWYVCVGGQRSMSGVFLG